MLGFYLVRSPGQLRDSTPWNPFGSGPTPGYNPKRQTVLYRSSMRGKLLCENINLRNILYNLMEAKWRVTNHNKLSYTFLNPQSAGPQIWPISVKRQI